MGPLPPGTDRRGWATLEVERLAKQLRALVAGSVVIDTRRLFVAGGSGQELTEWPGAQYVYLPKASASEISIVVQREVAKLR